MPTQTARHACHLLQLATPLHCWPALQPWAYFAADFVLDVHLCHAGPTPRASDTGPCPSSRKEPLDINNLLLRGSVLRKTPWVIGMAINVGNDSKIVQNMTKAPRKVCTTLTGWCTNLQHTHAHRSHGLLRLLGPAGSPCQAYTHCHVCCVPAQVTQLERAMNVLVFVQFSALLVFSAVLAVLDQFWTTQNIPAMWYLQSQNKWPELPPSGLGWLVAVGTAASISLVALQQQQLRCRHLLSMSLRCLLDSAAAHSTQARLE